jgi:hypothetical protein
MGDIFSAKTPAGIESGLKKLTWQQLARMSFLHLPCLLCCLSAVMNCTANLWNVQFWPAVSAPDISDKPSLMELFGR